jgi:hypothetical protein
VAIDTYHTLYKLAGSNKMRELGEDLSTSTLSDLKISFNTELLITDRESADAGDESTQDNEALPELDPENTTSILVYDELDPNEVDQFYINLEWTYAALLEKLRAKYKVEKTDDVRLRVLLGNMHLFQEDLTKKLRNLATFAEGGLRVCFERGLPPNHGNMVMTCEYNGVEHEIYVPETAKVGDLRREVASTFTLDPETFKLYKADWLREPSLFLKNDSQKLEKVGVRSSDLILAVPLDVVFASELIKVELWVTETGLPSSLTFVKDVMVNSELPFDDLKTLLAAEVGATDAPLTHIRLRELGKFKQFGKIYREGNKSISKLGIGTDKQLVLQVLAAPEELGPNDIVFLCCRRIVESREFGDPIEIIMRDI